jgi:hypothetical protein
VLLAALLLAHGVMGAFDTLVNHELIEGLPHRPKGLPGSPGTARSCCSK